MVSVSKGEYRYGMNTQEKDNEIYGEGNSYSAEYWQYDARLGRRWNVDPKDVPSFSPYSCFANNPIWFSDVNGDSSSSTTIGPLQKPAEHKVEAGDNLWKIAKSTYEEHGGDKSFEQYWKGVQDWNANVKMTPGAIVVLEDPTRVVENNRAWHPPMIKPKPSKANNKYVITNPDFKDINLGQYAASDKPAVSGNIPFTTYITPAINGNNVTISASIDYFNSMGDPVTFTSVAFLYGSDGTLINSQSLSSKLDYSNGKQYFLPKGWIGSTTFKMINANNIKAHNYSVQVKTTGVVHSPAGSCFLTIPGSLFTTTNYGVNSFDIKLQKK